MKAALASLCCTLAVFAARPAHALDTARAAARLELSKGPGTEQCIDSSALTVAVESRLQRRAFRQDLPATLYVRIVLERRFDATWSAAISLRDASGTALGSRSIVTRAAHCSALDDSLALVVALLVDSPPVLPSAEAGHDSRPVSSDAVTDRVTPPKQTISPPRTTTLSVPRDTPALREPWLFRLSLEGGAAIGLLPRVAPGAELGVGGTPPRLPELRLFAGLYPVAQEQRAGANSGARFRAGNVGLELCPWD